MRVCRCAIVVSLFIWLGTGISAFGDSPTTARPEPGDHPMTLADLERLALQHNPTLVQAAAQSSAAQGRALQAGLYPNPTIGYSGEEMGVEGSAGQQGIFVDQLIVTGGKLRYSRATYMHEVTQMNWQAVAQQYRVINGIRMRFYRALALGRLVSVRTDLLKIAQEAVTTTEEMVNVGQANRPDLLAARVEARRQRVGLQTAENRHWGAWQELIAFVGCPDLPSRRLQGDLEQAGQTYEWASTLAHLLEASPEVQVARAKAARARCALAREQVEPIPNLNVRAATQYNDETNDQQASVEVGLRLPIFDRNQGNIRAAEADVTRADAEAARVELALRRRLAEVFARYQSALNAVQEYQKHILPETRESYQLYAESFRARRAAWPQVLVAQRTYFQSAVEYVEALVELRRLEVAISGLLLVDGLEEPPGPEREGGERISADRQLEEALDRPIGRRMPDERAGNEPRMD